MLGSYKPVIRITTRHTSHMTDNLTQSWLGHANLKIVLPSSSEVEFPILKVRSQDSELKVHLTPVMVHLMDTCTGTQIQSQLGRFMGKRMSLSSC